MSFQVYWRALVYCGTYKLQIWFISLNKQKNEEPQILPRLSKNPLQSVFSTTSLQHSQGLDAMEAVTPLCFESRSLYKTGNNGHLLRRLSAQERMDELMFVQRNMQTSGFSEILLLYVFHRCLHIKILNACQLFIIYGPKGLGSVKKCQSQWLCLNKHSRNIYTRHKNSNQFQACYNWIHFRFFLLKIYLNHLNPFDIYTSPEEDVKNEMTQTP